MINKEQLKADGYAIEYWFNVYADNNVDNLHDRIKELYPDAKLSKHDGYVKVEKRE